MSNIGHIPVDPFPRHFHCEPEGGHEGHGHYGEHGHHGPHGHPGHHGHAGHPGHHGHGPAHHGPHGHHGPVDHGPHGHHGAHGPEGCHGYGGNPFARLVEVTTRELGYLLRSSLGFLCSPGIGFLPPYGSNQSPPPNLDGGWCHGGDNDQWTVSNPGQGKATIDLGDDYELQLDENRSEMKLVNKETGETTDVWGDPHINMTTGGQGKQFDFKGPVTLHLKDGTEINIQTVPYKNNPNVTLSSTVTITRGDRAITVTGLDQNQTGDLKISQSEGGRWLQATEQKGTNLYEGQSGQGWLDNEGQAVTQGDFDKPQPQWPGEDGGCREHDLGQALATLGICLVGLAFLEGAERGL